MSFCSVFSSTESFAYFTRRPSACAELFRIDALRSVSAVAKEGRRASTKGYCDEKATLRERSTRSLTRLKRLQSIPSPNNKK